MKKYAVFFVAALALILSQVILPPSLAQRGGRRGPIRVEEGKGSKGKADKTPAAKPKSNAATAAARALRQQEQDAPVTPQSSQAVAFAVTAPVAELEADKGPGTDVVDPAKVTVRDNEVLRQVLPGEPGSPDAALQTSAPAFSALSAPAAINSFDGISNADNANFGVGRVLPPDTVGDVGPNHYVQAVNLLVRIYNKNGTALGNPFLMSTLFSALPAGNACRTSDDGDPIVLYDQLADRWMISQFATVANPNTHQCIAVSKTGDPTGQYYVYDFQMPNNKFNDYPHFGVYPDAYYMTDNQFNQAGTAFQGGGVFAFNRQKMLVGDPAANFIYFDLASNDGGMLPADADGLIAPPAGAPGYFSQFTAGEFGDPSDALRIWEFRANFNTPANSTFTQRADSPVAVAAFDPRAPNSRNVVEQPSPGIALDAIQDRLMNRLQYLNFGGYESLIVAHSVNVGPSPTTAAGHQAAVRYYELRRALPGGNFTVPEQATFAPDAGNRWMPSAAMDNKGNLAVGYSVSSTTVKPSVRYAGRLASDPANQLAQGEAELIAGTGVQTHSSGRWGDYSSLNVDPVDDCTFWFTTEYYTAASQASSAAGWATRIGSFKFPTCTPPRRGTLSGTITNCNLGTPVAGALVQVSDGHSRVTDASGNYSMDLPPGTYTVTATAPGLAAPAPQTVTITDGAAATSSLCLSGFATIQTAGSAVTAESCVPADNAAGPGETVTMELALKNTGTADSTNLIATLQPSGGIQPLSGPQNYGAVSVGGASASRPFTFTVDSSLACGSAYTLTLQLQDGTTNLGTVSYTFNAGALGATLTNTYGTNNINTPIPDLGTVDIPINVANAGAVTDVNVRLRLNHSFDGDLEIKLVHPDGTQVMLSNRRGGSGDNYGSGASDCSGTFTVFDDSAAGSISGGVAPFNGSFRPDSPLAALNGKASNGTWKLRISDGAALDTGSVGCAQLVVSRQQYICCGIAGTPIIEGAPPAVLVSESAAPANNAPDPDETVTMNFPIRNIGDGATTNLVATLLPTGGVTAPSGPATYGAVPATGMPVSKPFTFVARGACGGDITATLRLQDGPTHLGNVTYTIRLGSTVTNTTNFSNAAAISVPAGAPTTTSGSGAPYPSAINVSGITGTVSKVTVTLKNMNHTFPDDMDVLLVGPGGQKLLLMSDAGGSGDLINRMLTFDDAATASLPDSAQINTGTFKPTNFGTGDTFAAPAPAGPHADPQLLSVFNNTGPNGQWRLFVTDDVGGDSGNINGGWELSITTSDPSCVNQACALNTPGNIVASSDPGSCGAIVNYAAPTFTGNCGVVTTDIPSGSFFPVGTTTVTVTGTRADNSTTTATFNVKVNDTENPAVVAPPDVTLQTGSSGASCGVTVGNLDGTLGTATANDNCGIANVARSGVPAGNNFPVGQTTITYTATDVHGNTVTDTQVVTVVDDTPPVIGNPTVNPSSIWSPNHRMVDVAVGYDVTDNCGAVTTTLSVTSSEPVNGTGDGDTAPDWEVLDNHRVRLRAERAGGGNGRVYTVTIKATDAAGNVWTRAVTVNVPKSQGK